MKRIALFFILIFLLAYAAKAQTVDSLWNGYLSPFVQTGGTAPNFNVQGQFVSNGGFTGSQIELSKKPRLIVYSSNKCYELPFTALSGTGSIIAGTVIDRSGQLSAIPSGSAIIYQPSNVYRVGPFPTGVSASLQGCLQTYNNLKIDSIQVSGGSGVTPGDKQDIDVVSTNVWLIDTNAVTTIKIANSAVDSNKIAANAVRTSDIGNAQVTMPKIAQSGAASGQVIKWNGSAWAPAADDVGAGITDFTGASGAPPSAAASDNDAETWRNNVTGELWGSDGSAWYPFLFGHRECLDTVSLAAIIVQPGGVVQTGSPLIRNTSGVWEHLYDNATVYTIPDGVVVDIIPGPKALIGYCGVMPLTGATPNSSYYVDETQSTGYTTIRPTSNIRPLGKVASNGDFLVNAGLLFSKENFNLVYEFSDPSSAVAPTIGVDDLTGPFWAYNTDAGVHWKWDKELSVWVQDKLVTSTELAGQGVTGSPLKLAQQSATPDQVLKWNGTQWAPGTDATGGGGAQTLQQVLTTGATLTQANVINNSVGQLSILGRNIRVDTLVNGSGQPKGQSLQTYRTTGLGGFLQSIVTTQGDTVTGNRPYGNYYSTIDNSFVNSDGQRDAVWHYGYNSNGGGGKVNPNEAEVHWAIESHYIGGGTSPTGDFEVHLESTAKNGNKNRHMSYNIQKATGLAKVFNAVDYVDYRSTGTGLPYFILERDNAAGTAQFRILTGTTPATNSEFRILGNTSGSQTDFAFNFTGATNKFLTINGINTLIYGGISGTFRQFSGQPMMYQSNASSGVQHMFNNSIGSTLIPILQVRNESTGIVSFNVHGNNRVTIGNYTTAPTSTLEVIANEGVTQPILLVKNSVQANNVFASNATPESAITANPGDVAHSNISSAGDLWVKKSGTGNTGWEKVITTSGTSTSVNRLMREESFTATAAQTAFTIAYSAPAVSGTSVPLRVYRNGVRLFYVASGPSITQFTYSGTTVTTAANAAGDVITVEYLN